MPVQHINRMGETYFLHQGTTRGGKPKWFFSRKRDGQLVEGVPDGYEIYEKPEGQVFLRRIPRKIIRDEELAMVRDIFRRLAGTPHVIVEAVNKAIVVHSADKSDFIDRFVNEFGLRRPPAAEMDRLVQQNLRYHPMFRFELVDPENREFIVSRWCFHGSIDDWSHPLGDGPLEAMAQKYAPHLEADSFFDLM